MDFPKFLTVRFRPTPELCRYRGQGIDTALKLDWVIERKTAIGLIRAFADNWRVIKDEPDKDHPLVSAVMPTCAGREKMVKYSIEQFKRQTWSEKELIIVNEGTDWLTDGSEVNIKEVRVHPGRYACGGLRNFGDALAGEYIITWDDDDIHHPDRIKKQIEAILISGSNCSTLKKRIHYFLDDDTAFIREGISVGLPLYKNEGFKHVPDMRSGSDQIFFDSYYRHTSTKLDNWPGLYVRIWHGSNVWDKNHCLHGTKIRPGEWRVGDCEEYLRAAIREYREAIT